MGWIFVCLVSLCGLIFCSSRVFVCVCCWVRLVFLLVVLVRCDRDGPDNCIKGGFVCPSAPDRCMCLVCRAPLPHKKKPHVFMTASQKRVGWLTFALAPPVCHGAFSLSLSLSCVCV